jgi:hypothetical protein
VLLLYADRSLSEADQAFSDPPAEARLWAAPGETGIATHVEGATTAGGFVENAWLAPPHVEAPTDPGPRWDPPTPVPTPSSTEATDGTGTEPAQPTRGSIEVRSVDAAQADLAGGCIRLTRTDRSFGYEPVCDGNVDHDAAVDLPGIVVIHNLEPGEYEVTEEPDPNRPPAQPQTVTISAGETAPVILPRAPEEPLPPDGTGSVSASWHDGNGQLLPGGCLQLDGQSSFGPYCDNEAGDSDLAGGVVQVDNLPPGSYFATETRPPTGYLPAQESSVPVQVDPGVVVPIQFLNAAQ